MALASPGLSGYLWMEPRKGVSSKTGHGIRCHPANFGLAPIKIIRSTRSSDTRASLRAFVKARSLWRKLNYGRSIYERFHQLAAEEAYRNSHPGFDCQPL